MEITPVSYCAGVIFIGIIRELIKIGGAGQRQRTVQVKVKRSSLGDNGVTRTRVRSRKAAVNRREQAASLVGGKIEGSAEALGMRTASVLFRE